jgi:peptide deformylase
MRHSTKGNIGVYNPEILTTSEEKIAQEEGCLSFPLLFFMVTRPSTCIVKFQDKDKKYHEMELTGTDAQCFQHEYDHLEGLLFLEYASDMKLQRAIAKREKTVKKLLRMQKNGNS